MKIHIFGGWDWELDMTICILFIICIKFNGNRAQDMPIFICSLIFNKVPEFIKSCWFSQIEIFKWPSFWFISFCCLIERFEIFSSACSRFTLSICKQSHGCIIHICVRWFCCFIECWAAKTCFKISALCFVRIQLTQTKKA